MSIEDYLKEEVRLVPCMACDGEGGTTRAGVEPAHHPGCRGECRNCPVPVQVPIREPCQYCETTGEVIVLPSTVIEEKGDQ